MGFNDCRQNSREMQIFKSAPSYFCSLQVSHDSCVSITIPANPQSSEHQHLLNSQNRTSTLYRRILSILARFLQKLQSPGSVGCMETMSNTKGVGGWKTLLSNFVFKTLSPITTLTCFPNVSFWTVRTLVLGDFGFR